MSARGPNKRGITSLDGAEAARAGGAPIGGRGGFLEILHEDDDRPDAPRLLPADLPDFTGREEQLATVPPAPDADPVDLLSARPSMRG